MDNKGLLKFPKPENQAEIDGINNMVLLAKNAGFAVRTVNTADEPCEPQPMYNDLQDPFYPTEEQQIYIDKINVEANKLGLHIIGTRPNDR